MGGEEDYSYRRVCELFPKLNYSNTCPRSDKREETVISRLHIDQSFKAILFTRGLLRASHVASCLPYNTYGCFLLILLKQGGDILLLDYCVCRTDLWIVYLNL